MLIIVVLAGCSTRDSEPTVRKRGAAPAKPTEPPAQTEAEKPVAEAPPPESPALKAMAGSYHRFGTAPSDEKCIEYAKSLRHALETDDLLTAANAVDWEAILDAATGGIEQARRQFPMAVSLFESKLPTQYRRLETIIDEIPEGGSVRFLRVRELDGRKSVLFRFIDAEGDLGYVELPLVKRPDGKVQAIDIYTHQVALLSEILREGYQLAILVEEAGGLDKLDATTRLQLEHFPKIREMADNLNQDQFDRVLELYDQLPASLRHTRRALLLRIKAAFYVDQQKMAAAVQEFRQHFPGDPAGDLVGACEQLLENEQYDRYLAAYESMDRDGGGDPYLNIYRGRVFLHQGDYAQARQLAQKAIEADPTLIYSWWFLVDISLAEEDFDETLRLLQTIVEKFDIFDWDLPSARPYAEFVKSTQYQQFVRWLESHPQPEDQRPSSGKVASPVKIVTAPPTGPQFARDGPLTAWEMDRWYRVPEGQRDVTPLWLRALRPFDPQAFRPMHDRIHEVGLDALWRDEDAFPLPGRAWNGLTEANALLNDYAKPLRRLHRAAAMDGGVRYPITFAEGLRAKLPHGEQIRNAVRMLSIEAFARAHRGDAQGTAQSIQTMFRTNRTLQYEPILVTQLVRVAMNRTATRQLERLLGRIDFPESDLAVLQTELLADNYQDGLYRALMGERIIGLWVFEKPKERIPKKFVKYLKDVPTERLEDLEYYKDLMQRAIDATRRSWPECLGAANQLVGEIDTRIRTAPEPELRKYVVTLQITPAFDAASEALARGAASNRLTVTAIAAELYRRQNSHLPENLTALVPNFLPSLPTDPFDGEPPHYEPHDHGFTISNFDSSQEGSAADSEDQQRCNLRFQVR